MSLYYLSPCESQESYARFAKDQHHVDRLQNECFATNSESQNHAEASTGQAVWASDGDEGLVTYETPTPPSVPSTLPSHIDIGREWLSKRPKPRGRHARKPKQITNAAVRLSKEERKDVIAKRASDREAVAFSLNFSPKKIAQLEASADPARIIYSAINARAKELLGYPLSLSFEFDLDDNDRLHCHGIAILPDWTNETVAKFRQVLKRAGGIMHGSGGARQVDVDRLKDWKGWAGYQHKNVDRVIARLGTDKIDYTSRELKRVAFGDHDADLQKQKARRRTLSQPRNAKPGLAGLTHSPEPKARQRPSMSQSAEVPAKSKLTYHKYLKSNNKRSTGRLTAIREYAMNSTANPTLLRIEDHMQTILDNATYTRLMDALLAASADAYVSKDTDAFKIALGEVAGIWPETVLASHNDANLVAPARSAFERPTLSILDIDAMLEEDSAA